MTSVQLLAPVGANLGCSGCAPLARGPLPAIIVHPEAGHSATEMRGRAERSQGGVFSLLIAAYDRGVAAVVAYYPVTDFETWLQASGAGPGRRLAFRFIHAGLRLPR